MSPDIASRTLKAGVVGEEGIEIAHAGEEVIVLPSAGRVVVLTMSRSMNSRLVISLLSPTAHLRRRASPNLD